MPTKSMTYTIHTPAAMFKGFTVTQFHTPAMAQATKSTKISTRKNKPPK